MKLLLHTCCAPCSIYVVKYLRNDNIEPDLYWYNPNIHPYTEYIKRKETLEKYSEMINIKTIFEDEYGLQSFIKNTSDDIEQRCINYCYKTRLEKTVKYAKENNYDAFSTTLLSSIYQKHEEIKRIAEELSKEYKIDFLYHDFREGFREGQNEARKLQLYMQKYCGCIFSEEERYKNG